MKKVLLTTFALMFCIQSHGFGAFFSSSQILKKGELDALGALQFFSGDESGTEFSGTIDVPFRRDTNLRFSVGTGTLSFFTSALIKWVPIPDIKKQPAVGLLGGIEYASEDSLDFLMARATPFVSKSFNWEYGTLEPYTAVTLALLRVDTEATDDTEFASQFIVGSKIKFEALPYMSFSLEGGFKLKELDNYFGFAATIQLSR